MRMGKWTNYAGYGGAAITHNPSSIRDRGTAVNWAQLCLRMVAYVDLDGILGSFGTPRVPRLFRRKRDRGLPRPRRFCRWSGWSYGATAAHGPMGLAELVAHPPGRVTDVCETILPEPSRRHACFPGLSRPLWGSSQKCLTTRNRRRRAGRWLRTRAPRCRSRSS